MYIIVISPHPDDAAFSLGGLLARLAGAAILLITCFSRSCALNRRDSPATTKKRALEDENYARRIGARLVRLGLPDSGLRTNTGREGLREEDELRLRLALATQLQPVPGDWVATGANSFIFVPLAIGDHPDHIHCREIALASFSRERLVFYEDLPYGQMVGGPGRVNAIVRQQYPQLREILVALEPEQMNRKMQGLAVYASQLHPTWRAAIEDYALHSGAKPGEYGERFWLPSEPEIKIPQWMPR